VKFGDKIASGCSNKFRGYFFMPHPVVLAETTLQSSVPVCSLI